MLYVSDVDKIKAVAVLAERERCAKIAESFDTGLDYEQDDLRCRDIAAAIREPKRL